MTTTPGIYNFYIYQGATYYSAWAFVDCNDDPLNLTGLTAQMQMRKHSYDSDVIINLTTENGGLVIDGAAGIVTVYVDAETTADLEILPDGQSYVYDLYFYNAEYSPVERDRILMGNITVSAEVTQWQ